MASTFKRLTPPSSSRIVSEPAAVVANDLESSSLGPTPKGEGGNVTFLPGTKPWTSGITLTSTGLRDLDNILSSSGQPLGTCIWLEEDRWTNHLARSLVQYWCAEVS